jgi:hypothetical protein
VFLMKKFVRGSLYTALVFGAGWFAHDVANTPSTGSIDYNNYQPGTNFEVVFQYYDEREEEWVDDRSGLVDTFSIPDMTAEGVNNRGQRCRGFVRYNSSRSHDFASR